VCIYDRYNMNYSRAFAIFCILIPCISISICYSKIFFYARKAKRNVSQGTSQSKKKQLESIRIAKSLFISFFLFAICWYSLIFLYIFYIIVNYLFIRVFYNSNFCFWPSHSGCHTQLCQSSAMWNNLSSQCIRQ
jgi:ABC-type Fe3+ transport system permease subunit